MAKRKTRTKSKIAEMVKVIGENNHRRIQAIPNSGDILVAAGFAEYVEDVTEDSLAEPTNKDVDNAQVKSDSTVDAPLNQTNHSNVKLPRTTHLPTEDAETSQEISEKGDPGDATESVAKEEADRVASKNRTRGPRDFPLERVLKVIDTWENRGDFHPWKNLEEFLEEEFGTRNGELIVCRSTFYSWREKYWKPLREK